MQLDMQAPKTLPLRTCSGLRPARIHFTASAPLKQKAAAPQCRATGTASSSNAIRGAKYFSADRRPIILFDGVCNLCNGGVNFALDWDNKQRLRFSALQSPAGKELLQRSGRDPEDISSIVLVEEHASHIKSEAILRIAKLLELPFPVLARLGFPFPLFFRDAVYDQIANSRYDIFGKTTVCRMMDEKARDRFIE